MHGVYFIYMSFTETKSFKLATYAQGDINSSKVALVLPGRLDTKDYVHMATLVDYLAKQGYYAVSFDVPGTWESPGDISKYSTTLYLKATNELIEYFGNKPTLLVGHSRGSTIAMLASGNPVVTGIVVIMATYGLPTGIHPEISKRGFIVEQRDLPPGSVRSKEKVAFNLSNYYFTDGQKYEPVEILRRLNKPKLLIYGDEDEFTQPQRVKEVFASIPKPKMIHEVKSEHDYRLHSDVIDEVNATVGSFIEDYL